VKIDEKRKCNDIFTKLLSRITFEKGKANFIRQLQKKFYDYELTLANKIIFEKSKVEISDHLKALRLNLIFIIFCTDSG
jgi:serine/threonine-protein kinase ULK/ATG1